MIIRLRIAGQKSAWPLDWIAHRRGDIAWPICELRDFHQRIGATWEDIYIDGPKFSIRYIMDKGQVRDSYDQLYNPGNPCRSK